MEASENENRGPWSNAIVGSAAAGALLLWISQPPWSFWPLALIALVPWILIVTTQRRLTRREYLGIWAAGFCYWLISLQGLRHANPALYVPWVALAGYLAIYPLMFVVVCRQLLVRRVPIWLAAPVAWVGQEWMRNYLLTGISAAMLGHTMADVPIMIQIADMFGSYGVSLVVVSINVAAFQLWVLARRRWGASVLLQQDDDQNGLGIRGAVSRPSLIASLVVSIVLLSATLLYGYVRLQQPLDRPLATFALIQRSEPVEYSQDEQREIEIFQNYARESVAAVAGSKVNIDAVVWPESMFTGALPWMIAEENFVLPEGAQVSRDKFKEFVEGNRGYFLRRARDLDAAMVSAVGPERSRSLIVGCGVVRYGQSPEVYSGVVHLPPANSRSTPPLQWYGKTHLVMFGEYIPLVSYIPGLREYVRSMGMGLTPGPGPRPFQVNDTVVLPSICIETAVERVTVRQLRELQSTSEMPDVLVTVTNDGWFDDSSVIDHHLRCAQLVAVACRRPLLSAANNGPTAWIDSFGQIVQRLPTGSTGNLIATPQADLRESLYLRIGDWPATLLGVLCLVFCVDAFVARRKHNKLMRGNAANHGTA
jgi:apolipoprotein N-acyltransferase